ncbi:DUF4942 domain-containing protein [Photobacterium leiognathi]|uniref:DUF4942 domain-containing protein n=1 Tax=Photobacterium leiognathi TaxID=553611 RepID=UPI002982B640|nr:DUF4942 domain-containing protein [Photobacterium leiognathi]
MNAIANIPSSFKADNRSATQRLLKQVKEQQQDFEWYPTTDEILDVIKSDIIKTYKVREIGHGDDPTRKYINKSILDVGAGDGRALMKLTDGKRYAIEKSTVLQQAMDASIFLIGTDFHQQTLMDKQVNIVFCNPPYLEYDAWTCKVIREANCEHAYFVIPHRWEVNSAIERTLKDRGAIATRLKLLDFKDADRQARAIVDIIRVDFSKSKHEYYRDYDLTQTVDAFSLWFKNEFEPNKTESDISKKCKAEMDEERLKEKQLRNDIISQQGLVKSLEEFYNRDMTQLLDTYKSLTSIDEELLSELSVKMKDVRELLRMKVASLKAKYWKELFDNLEDITSRLTSTSRTSLLELMQNNMSIDFTAQNAFAVCIWVLKNCNNYFDSQLIEVFESIYSLESAKNYKSNEKTLVQDKWRYNRASDHSHYKLDYRVVCHGLGGLGDNSWHYRNHGCGLQERSVDNINNILTVANNLGFLQNDDCPKAQSFAWVRGEKQEFKYKDLSTGELDTLMEVKFYLNGNVWIKFNQKFMQKFNVEFGRLKGWLRSAKEAAEETGYDIETVQNMFKSNIQLEAKNMPLMLGSAL